MASIRSKADCDLTVSALNGRLVQPDELVELDDEVYQAHVWPEDTWVVVDAPEDPRTAAELKAELERRGLPTSGRKSELAKRLAEAPPEDAPAQPAPVVPADNQE